ncbi:MAG: M23 family metallopeptidase [Dehalococcoidia bacterium]|jgi:murein DD-endopeptidase MepM/ murein hydrolase activator NlpD
MANIPETSFIPRAGTDIAKNMSAGFAKASAAMRGMFGAQPGKTAANNQGYAAKAPQATFSSIAPFKAKDIGTVTTRPNESTRFEKSHPGIDIANKEGTAIPAFTPGKVTKVVSGQKPGTKGYGNYVVVTDSQGNRHQYSHLLKTYVNVGDAVGAASPVGAMGRTGSVYSTSGGTGTHLDYRVADAFGKWIDPTKYVSI